MSLPTSPKPHRFPFTRLQRFATSLQPDLRTELREAVQYHCAVKIASATAPNDELVGQCVDLEIKAKHHLLRLPAINLAEVSVKGRYLLLLHEVDHWELDQGTIEALMAGMSEAGSDPL